MIIHIPRYYEKSIIEQAIIEQRTNSNNHWDETKQSIREARHRLSLQSDTIELKHNQSNGGPPNSDTQTTLVPKMSYLETEEISLELTSP